MALRAQREEKLVLLVIFSEEKLKQLFVEEIFSVMKMQSSTACTAGIAWLT